eukprot:scaffold4.g4605.t1
MASADGTAGGGARTAVDEVGTAGEFKRTPSVFRNKIAKGTRFEPEAGRYHLYISLACPWANRCFAVLNMKGLESAIGVSVTHPTWRDWAFVSPGDPPLPNGNGYGAFPCDAACVPDTVNGVKFVRDLYELAGDQASTGSGGKYSVPVLWDKKERTIVNNESSEILRMLNSEFQDCAANPGLDLYPEELRPAIDEVNEWIYPSINNGVYSRCGFATGQQAYDAAYADLFAALDRCEGILAKQRYIAGSRLTEADLRLFMTLIRFDHVYIVYFKTNRQFISQFPNLSNYTKGIGESINLDHIKTHYFTSHPRLNYYGIIPPGPPEWWKEEHDRARLSRNVRESKGGLAFEVA